MIAFESDPLSNPFFQRSDSKRPILGTQFSKSHFLTAFLCYAGMTAPLGCTPVFDFTRVAARAMTTTFLTIEIALFQDFVVVAFPKAKERCLWTISPRPPLPKVLAE